LEVWGELLGQAHQLRKGSWIVYRHIGDHLPVQKDPSPLKASDEAAVGQPMFSGGGINPDNPKAAEFPLPCPSIPVSIHAGPADSRIGCPQLLTVTSPVPFCSF